MLKPVPPHTLVAGSPAKEIGVVAGNPALDMEQWNHKVCRLHSVRHEHGGQAEAGCVRANHCRCWLSRALVC